MNKESLDLNFFKTIVENSADMTYQISLTSGLCEYVNEAAHHITGFHPEDFYNNQNLIKDLLHPFLGGFLVKYTTKTSKSSNNPTDYPKSCEFQIIHKSGSIKWLHHKNFIIFNDKQEPIKFYGIITDITDSKGYEKAKNDQKKYELIYDNMVDVVWTLDIKTGLFNYVSPSVYNLRGYTPEEVLKQSMEEVMTQESLQYINNILQKTIKSFLKGERKLEVYEVDQICKDGSIVPTEVMTKFLLDENGQPKEVLGVSRDISYRKRAEKEIRENEKKYRSLYNSMNEGLAIHHMKLDNEGNLKDFIITDLNPAYEKILGLKKENVINKGIFEIYGSAATQYKDLIIKVATKNTRTSFEAYFESFDKYYFISLFSTEKNQFVALFEDITFRKKTQKELEKHAHNMEILNEIIKLTNKSNNLDDLLKNVMTTILDLMNFKYASVFLIDEKRRVAYPKLMIRVPEGIHEHYKEVDIDGTHQELLVGGEPFISGDFSKIRPDLSEKWKCSSVARIPILYKNKVIGAFSVVDESPYSFSSDDVAILKSVGRELGTVMIRVQAEEKIKKSLHEKDLLLREIHHRVKNNLQIISSLINLQSFQLKDKETAQILLDSQNRVRSLAMVHEILYKSRDLGKIDLNEYINMLISNLSKSFLLGEGLIEIGIECEGLKINIDTAIPLGLIITEIITNSIKYAFPAGKGLISVKLYSEHDNCEENEKIVLILKDDGIGINEEIELEHTKTLGLNLVNNLVKQLNGSLKLDRDSGTMFRISFQDLAYEKRI